MKGKCVIIRLIMGQIDREPWEKYSICYTDPQRGTQQWERGNRYNEIVARLDEISDVYNTWQPMQLIGHVMIAGVAAVGAGVGESALSLRKRHQRKSARRQPSVGK